MRYTKKLYELSDGVFGYVYGHEIARASQSVEKDYLNLEFHQRIPGRYVFEIKK